jgi:uncharacterized protein (DUF58 family)
MIPTLRLLRLLGIWLALGILASIWPRFIVLWQIAGVLLAFAAGGDAAFLFFARPLRVERKLPSRFALGVEHEVAITLHNPNRFGLTVEFFDGLPTTVTSEQLPWRGKVGPGGFTAVHYRAVSLERGPNTFTRCHTRAETILGLWQRTLRDGGHSEVKTYPNYEPVVRYTLLAMSHRESQMGIVAKNRVGQSREFHQLREYQDGDVLSQVDWKATARRGQLISREYREQRDQTLVLLLDCGRRMRALDGPLPQFDHCLNATLLLSYIALRQGDQVGVMSFGGTNRWLPPVKGQHSMSVLLNHLYDYQSTPEPSDFSEAAERLMTRQRRRALVILLTNLRTEDATHLIQPIQLLRRRHLVVVASLRERKIVEQMRKPVATFDDALLHSATAGYFADRAAFLGTLRDHGALTIDETAQALPGALASAYLDIKRRGAL